MARASHGCGVEPSAVDADDPLEAAVARAQAGDEAGFEVLWTALQPRLLRYLRVKAGDVAEDVAAETWLQVVRDLGRFRGSASEFRGWMFTVARNRAIDAARARRARPVHLLAEVPEPARTCVDSAETQALERVSTERALALVASLPADQAELVALRVVGGLDVSTVAQIVGKSPGAVRVSVHRALRTLSRVVDVREVDEIPAEVV